MNTNTLAAAIIGFLLGGLLVSTAASLEDDNPAPADHGSSQHDSHRATPLALAGTPARWHEATLEP